MAMMQHQPYEETMHWWRKITHAGRRPPRGFLRHEDEFDQFERLAGTIPLALLVIISAAVLETLLLPVVFGLNLWEALRRKDF